MYIQHCPHCERIKRAREGNLENCLFQNAHVTAIAGDHQFFPGYVVIIANTHVREMHNLDEDQASAIFREVMRAGRIIDRSFAPLKINYASLGNVDEHLHWHIFPRYLSDPDHKDHPWKNAVSFAGHKTTCEAIRHLRKIFQSSI
jgi:diadenosine tetraphosphate (Ap4A) HIT family hydrolase